MAVSPGLNPNPHVSLPRPHPSWTGPYQVGVQGQSLATSLQESCSQDQDARAGQAQSRHPEPTMGLRAWTPRSSSELGGLALRTSKDILRVCPGPQSSHSLAGKDVEPNGQPLPRDEGPPTPGSATKGPPVRAWPREEGVSRDSCPRVPGGAALNPSLQVWEAWRKGRSHKPLLLAVLSKPPSPQNTGCGGEGAAGERLWAARWHSGPEHTVRGGPGAFLL